MQCTMFHSNNQKGGHSPGRDLKVPASDEELGAMAYPVLVKAPTKPVVFRLAYFANFAKGDRHLDLWKGVRTGIRSNILAEAICVPMYSGCSASM